MTKSRCVTTKENLVRESDSDAAKLPTNAIPIFGRKYMDASYNCISISMSVFPPGISISSVFSPGSVARNLNLSGIMF